MGTNELIDEIKKTADSSGGVDFIALNDLIDVITSVGQLVLGLAIVGILILLPIEVAAEIMYINLPIVRGKLDDIMQRNKSANKIGHRIILRDAVEAVNRFYLGKSVNSNLEYVKIKSRSFIFIGFILSIAITGASALVSKTDSIVGVAIDYILNALR